MRLGLITTETNKNVVLSRWGVKYKIQVSLTQLMKSVYLRIKIQLQG